MDLVGTEETLYRPMLKNFLQVALDLSNNDHVQIMKISKNISSAGSHLADRAFRQIKYAPRSEYNNFICTSVIGMCLDLAQLLQQFCGHGSNCSSINHNGNHVDAIFIFRQSMVIAML